VVAAKKMTLKSGLSRRSFIPVGGGEKWVNQRREERKKMEVEVGGGKRKRSIAAFQKETSLTIQTTRKESGRKEKKNNGADGGGKEPPTIIRAGEGGERKMECRVSRSRKKTRSTAVDGKEKKKEGEMIAEGKEGKLLGSGGGSRHSFTSTRKQSERTTCIRRMRTGKRETRDQGRKRMEMTPLQKAVSEHLRWENNRAERKCRKNGEEISSHNKEERDRQFRTFSGVSEASGVVAIKKEEEGLQLAFTRKKKGKRGVRRIRENPGMAGTDKKLMQLFALDRVSGGKGE